MVKEMPAAQHPAQSPAKTAVVTRVTAEAISRRAYHLFKTHGSRHGHDVEDWLVAEAELLRGNHTEIASPVAETPRRVE